MNVSTTYDAFLLGSYINHTIIYEVSPDFFPISYSLITGKGDCYNLAKLYCFLMNIKGHNCNVLKLDTNNDNIPNHAISLINDSIGCYTMDLTSLRFKVC